jgi:hypothetical protein
MDKMKTKKCSVCGKEFPQEVIISECADCYCKGAEIERTKEREKILKLIDKWWEQDRRFIDSDECTLFKEQIKSKIKGEK